MAGLPPVSRRRSYTRRSWSSGNLTLIRIINTRVLIALCAHRFVGASAQPLSIPRQALGTCVASSTSRKLLIILVRFTSCSHCAKATVGWPVNHDLGIPCVLTPSTIVNLGNIPSTSRPDQSTNLSNLLGSMRSAIGFRSPIRWSSHTEIACIGPVGCRQRKHGIFNQLSSYSMSLPTHATLTGNRVLRCWRAIPGGRARISQPAQRSHQPIRGSTGKTYSVTTRIKRTWAKRE